MVAEVVREARWTLFEGLSPEVVAAFLSSTQRRRFAKGETLFHEGDPADTLHLIAKGTVAVRTSGALGESTTLRLVGQGEAVGELALIGPPAPRSATVVCAEGVETMALHRSEFERLLAEHPRVLEVLVQILAKRVRELSFQVLESRFVLAEVRVRRRILELHERANPNSGDQPIVVTQEELAGLAGTTRGTVNRVLSEEAKRGTLHTARGRIMVTDRAALARRAR